MCDASISQFNSRLVNQQRQINDCVFRRFDSSKYLTNLRSNISPCQRGVTLILIPFIIHHLISEIHQKNIWELPNFSLGCPLRSATVTSFSQLNLSRNSGSSRSLDQMNLHFLAPHTRWLIKESSKFWKTFEIFRKNGKFHI